MKDIRKMTTEKQPIFSLMVLFCRPQFLDFDCFGFNRLKVICGTLKSSVAALGWAVVDVGEDCTHDERAA